MMMMIETDKERRRMCKTHRWLVSLRGQPISTGVRVGLSCPNRLIA
jgi:hypothetical protein